MFISVSTSEVRRWLLFWLPLRHHWPMNALTDGIAMERNLDIARLAAERPRCPTPKEKLPASGTTSSCPGKLKAARGTEPLYLVRVSCVWGAKGAAEGRGTELADKLLPLPAGTSWLCFPLYVAITDLRSCNALSKCLRTEQPGLVDWCTRSSSCTKRYFQTKCRKLILVSASFSFNMVVANVVMIHQKY